MKKIIRLTESDLTRIVRRVIKEQQSGISRQYLKEDDFRGGVTLALMNQLTNYLNGMIPKAKAKNITMNSVFSVTKTGTATDKLGNPIPKYTINYGSKDLFQGEVFSDADIQSMRSDSLNKIYPTRINTKLSGNGISTLKSNELSKLWMNFDILGDLTRVYKSWVASIEPPAKTPGVKTPTKP